VRVCMWLYASRFTGNKNTMCVCVCVCVLMYIRLYVCIYVCIVTAAPHICTNNVHIQNRMYAHKTEYGCWILVMCSHTYTHTCMHTYIHAQAMVKTTYVFYIQTLHTHKHTKKRQRPRAWFAYMHAYTRTHTRK
jgi:hypothetical protein